ncbi:MAG: hypothetical protein ACYCOU_00700 [Sulfobacillus sp.]
MHSFVARWCPGHRLVEPWSKSGGAEFREPWSKSGGAEFREPWSKSGGAEFREPWSNPMFLEGHLAQVRKRAQELVCRGENSVSQKDRDPDAINKYFEIRLGVSVPGSEESFFNFFEEEGLRQFVDWLADRLPFQLSFPPGVVELLSVGQSKGLKERDVPYDLPYIVIPKVESKGLMNVGPCSCTSGFIDEGPFDWILVATDLRTNDNGCGYIAVNCNPDSPRYGNVLYRPMYDEDDCCIVARDLDEFYRMMDALPAHAYSVDFLAPECADRCGVTWSQVFDPDNGNASE